MSLLGMQFTQRAGYPAHTDCGPFMWLSGMDNEDDEERSRCLATLDTHGHLPASDLAVKITTTLALLHGGDGSHYAVHLSLQGRSRQLTRLQNFFELGFQLLPLCHIPFFKRCCGAKKGMWHGGYGLKCTPHAHECVCTRPSLVFITSSYYVGEGEREFNSTIL